MYSYTEALLRVARRKRRERLIKGGYLLIGLIIAAIFWTILDTLRLLQ